MRVSFDGVFNLSFRISKNVFVLLILIVLFPVGVVEAQNDPLFTQYMNNTIVTNPAYAGSHDVIQGIVLGRTQWVGFEGAPKTVVAGFHAPVRKYNLGLGVDVVSDKIGPVEESRFSFNTSYRIKLSENKVDRVLVNKTNGKWTYRKKKERVDSYLAFGLKATYSQFRLNSNPDEFVDNRDPLLNSLSSNKINFGAGIYYYAPNFYFGVSVPQLLTNDISVTEEVQYHRDFNKLRYYVSGGYVYTLSPSIKFKPTFMLRVVEGTRPLVELTPNVLFYDKLWLGMGYRFGGDITALLQYYLNPKIRIGYSYDLIANDLIQYNAGSHELSISFDLKLKKGDMECQVYF